MWERIGEAINLIEQSPVCCGDQELLAFMNELDSVGTADYSSQLNAITGGEVNVEVNFLRYMADVMTFCKDIQVPSLDIDFDLTFIDDIAGFVGTIETEIENTVDDVMSWLEDALAYQSCCDQDLASLIKAVDILGSSYNLATCGCTTPNECVQDTIAMATGVSTTGFQVIMDLIGQIPGKFSCRDLI